MPYGRGRATMKALYRHLNWNDWHLKHHIDHHLGRLTQRRYEALVQGKNVEKESIPVYTPDRWLVGQLPTKSNICGRKWTQTRFFNDAKNADHSDAPFFAVLGPIAVAPAASQWSCIIWAFTWATNSVAMRQRVEAKRSA